MEPTETGVEEEEGRVGAVEIGEASLCVHSRMAVRAVDKVSLILCTPFTLPR